MGKIIIGREKRRDFESLTGYEGRKAPGKRGMTIEEQRAMAEKLLKGVPESQWVAVLMSHGLNDVADEANRALAEKAAWEAEVRARAAAEKAEKEAAEKEPAEDGAQPEEDARAARLAEIMAMPEDRRLVALVEEGYEEEAKALVEARAAGAAAEEVKEKKAVSKKKADK